MAGLIELKDFRKWDIDFNELKSIKTMEEPILPPLDETEQYRNINYENWTYLDQVFNQVLIAPENPGSPEERKDEIFNLASPLVSIFADRHDKTAEEIVAVEYIIPQKAEKAKKDGRNFISIYEGLNNSNETSRLALNLLNSTDDQVFQDLLNSTDRDSPNHNFWKEELEQFKNLYESKTGDKLKDQELKEALQLNQGMMIKNLIYYCIDRASFANFTDDIPPKKVNGNFSLEDFIEIYTARKNGSVILPLPNINYSNPANYGMNPNFLYLKERFEDGSLHYCKRKIDLSKLQNENIISFTGNKIEEEITPEQFFNECTIPTNLYWKDLITGKPYDFSTGYIEQYTKDRKAPEVNIKVGSLHLRSGSTGFGLDELLEQSNVPVLTFSAGFSNIDKDRCLSPGFATNFHIQIPQSKEGQLKI